MSKRRYSVMDDPFNVSLTRVPNGTGASSLPQTTSTQSTLGFIPGQWENTSVPAHYPADARPSFFSTRGIMATLSSGLSALARHLKFTRRIFGKAQNIRAEPVLRTDGCRKKILLDSSWVPNCLSFGPQRDRPQQPQPQHQTHVTPTPPHLPHLWLDLSAHRTADSAVDAPQYEGGLESRQAGPVPAVALGDDVDLQKPAGSDIPDELLHLRISQLRHSPRTHSTRKQKRIAPIEFISRLYKSAELRHDTRANEDQARKAAREYHDKVEARNKVQKRRKAPGRFQLVQDFDDDVRKTAQPQPPTLETEELSFLPDAPELPEDEHKEVPASPDGLFVTTTFNEELSTLEDAPPLKACRFALDLRVKEFGRDNIIGDEGESIIEPVIFSPEKREETQDEASISHEVLQEIHEEMVQQAPHQTPSKVPTVTIVPPPSVVFPDPQAAELKIIEQASVQTGGGTKNIKLSKTLSTHDFSTLLPTVFNGNKRAWLNDEIVNGYLELLVNYVKKEEGYIDGKHTTAPPVHAFSSHWFTSAQGGVSKVARWAKRKHFGGIELLKLKLLLIPICSGAHWTLLAIRPQDRVVEYLDSLKGDSSTYVNLAYAWLKQELGVDFHPGHWSTVIKRSKKQDNSNDCGVFTCMNALASLKDMDPGFLEKSADMMDARCRIAISLLSGKPTGEF